MTIKIQFDDNEWVAAAESDTYAASGFGATREEAVLDLCEGLESMLMASQDDLRCEAAQHTDAEDRADNLAVAVDSLVAEVDALKAQIAQRRCKMKPTDFSPAYFEGALNALKRESEEFHRIANKLGDFRAVQWSMLLRQYKEVIAERDEMREWIRKLLRWNNDRVSYEELCDVISELAAQAKKWLKETE